MGAEATECVDLFRQIGVSRTQPSHGNIVWNRFQLRRHVDKLNQTERRVLIRTGVFESTAIETNVLKLSFDYIRQTLRGASRPSVVLLHGVFNRREDLQKLSSEFEQRGWNVLAIDLLGHGRSALLNRSEGRFPAPIDHRTQVIAISSLIQKIHLVQGLSAPLIVGHSLGGGLSMSLAKELNHRGLRPLANVPVTPYISSIDKFLLHHGFTPDVMSYFNDRLVEKLGLKSSQKNQNAYIEFWRNFFRVLYEPALLALDSPQFRPMAEFFHSMNKPQSRRLLEKAFRRYHELKSTSDLATLKVPEAELDILIQGAIAATQGVKDLNFQARRGATKIDPTIPTLVISGDRDQIVIPPQIRDFKTVAETFGYDITFVEMSGDHHLPQRRPADLAEVILEFLAERNLLP